MVMPEVTEVGLLGVVLTGEATFWLCEPTQLKPLPQDWKSANCRWLYPVEENLSAFADLSGFESTDAVYEVDWRGTSKILRPATLAWNVRGKRQKVAGTTYVFVPAEEIKVLDEAFKRFVKQEAQVKLLSVLQPPSSLTPVPSSPSASPAPHSGNASSPGAAEGASLAVTAEGGTTESEEPPNLGARSSAKLEEDETEAKVSAHTPSQRQSGIPPATRPPPPLMTAPSTSAEEVGVDTGGAENVVQLASEVEDANSAVSSSVAHERSAQRRGLTNTSLFPSHKRQTPHRGTTVYQAPIHSKPTGSHRSNEAFEWGEMFVVHRGSVDYLCPQSTGNTYGFRLDRVLHNGFPVFLLFASPMNNSEAIDPNAHGVPVFEKALLSGEGGEGAVRESVLVVTRLSSKKHQPRYRTNDNSSRAATNTTSRHRRPRRRRSDSGDDSTTTEEDEDVFFEEEEEEERERTARGSRGRPKDGPAATATVTVAATATKKPKTELMSSTDECGVSVSTTAHRKGKRKGTGTASRQDEPLQAMSVNLWTDPQHAAPAPAQLAREFPFTSQGVDAPQTAVFSNGICVTYTAATAAKHAAPEKKRKTSKHGGAATSAEDADLSMLNEHILSAFAQVKSEEG